LRKGEVERMTIFSLVKPEKLGSFFEIVAAALRTDLESDTPTTVTTEEKELESVNETKDSSERKWDYAAMTLPCIDFPAMKKRRTESEATSHFDPLYVTVTLMTDEDPRKRCFHCVFTDCPGTNGALGSITPELLGLLFTNLGGKIKKKSKQKHKRSRTGQSRASTDGEREEKAPASAKLEDL
jgi:hypothetical protein